MHFEAIEKALDHDDALPRSRSSMEIEQHERFSEPRRKAILGLRPSTGSACVSNEEAVFIMDRDDDSIRHGAGAAVISNAKVVNGFGANATLCQVRMRRIDLAQCKR